MSRKEVHIVRDKSRASWDVKQGGEVQSSHRTQKAAVERGTGIAKSDKVDLVIHGRDGKIRSKDSYGNESARRDTEH